MTIICPKTELSHKLSNQKEIWIEGHQYIKIGDYLDANIKK